MAADEIYRRQVALLVQTLPFVADESCFALKGGTAINFFHRNMPRLSVDIDLAYLPVADRPASLAEIDGAMGRIRDRIKAARPHANVHASTLYKEEAVNKLFVRTDDVQVKIEVTPVIRGCVYDSEIRQVAPMVEEQFGFAEIQTVSFADLYAGKLVAALDRQHPRDLFDVRDLLANEGIDDNLRKAFVVYMISHNRPMAEVLVPNPKDISQEFVRGFQGMTEKPISLEELVQAREDMIDEVVGNMPQDHRRFLVSFEEGKPQWSLLGMSDIDKLPAVQWRIKNLAKLSATKRVELVDLLMHALSMVGG